MQARIEKHVSFDAGAVNRSMHRHFMEHYLDEAVRRTHRFHGRYENIYMTPQQVPELEIVLGEAVRLAQRILQVEGLRAGCWFNYMPPGAVTTKHRHDDYDELLSGVYYVRVPDDSGDLVLYEDGRTDVITPQAGHFIFFRPDVPHEVTGNRSSEARLSIGINFGIPHEEDA